MNPLNSTEPRIKELRGWLHFAHIHAFASPASYTKYNPTHKPPKSLTTPNHTNNKLHPAQSTKPTHTHISTSRCASAQQTMNGVAKHTHTHTHTHVYMHRRENAIIKRWCIRVCIVCVTFHLHKTYTAQVSLPPHRCMDCTTDTTQQIKVNRPRSI